MRKRRIVKGALKDAEHTDKPDSQKEIGPGYQAQLRKQGSIRRLRGKIQWEGDIDESRKGHTG
jgi:hypothetical protein